MHYRINELSSKKINILIETYDYLKDLNTDEADDVAKQLEATFKDIDFSEHGIR